MMEQLRQNNTEEWIGKDLELLQEARNRIKQSQDNNQTQAPNSNIETKGGKIRKKFSKGAKWAIVVFGLLLFSYKLYVLYLQDEVDRFRSEVSGYDVSSDYSFLRKTGQFSND